MVLRKCRHCSIIFWKVLTFRKDIVFPYFPLSRSKIGEIILHGPHHVAARKIALDVIGS